MYKITSDNNIRKGNTFIPINSENSSYQQFIQDVLEQGYDIVEGPDIVQPSYAELREADYPPLEEQLDKIYHSGVNAWKAQIKQIKERHPKAITGRTDIGPLPDWLYQEINNRIYNQQLKAYVEAVERLAQYRLVDGQDRVVEEIEDVNGVIQTVETQPSIERLLEDDPRVIKDEEERAAAQAVIDSTPQNIIDAINH